MKKENITINESLNRMKYLFAHERGVVISEQQSAAKGDYGNPYTDSEMTGDIDSLVDILDVAVYETGLNSIKQILDKYQNKWAKNEEDPNNILIVPAITRLSDLYSIDESGDSLYNDISAIGETTMSTQAVTLKRQCLNILNNSKNQQAPQQAQTAKLNWSDGSEISKCLVQLTKDGHKYEIGKSDDGTEYLFLTWTDTNIKPGYFYKDGSLMYEDVSKPGQYIEKKWTCSEQPDANGRYNLQYV
jgi:hypothetical protein